MSDATATPPTPVAIPPAQMDPQARALWDRARALGTWQYRYQLGPGVVIPQKDETHAYHLRRRKMIFSILENVIGHERFPKLSFLDCACNAGLWSMELYKRGARDIDAFDGRPDNVAKCELVRELRGIDPAQVRFRVGNVYNLSEMYQPKDVVLGFGYMYHLENPIAAAKELAKVTKWLCLVDSNVCLQAGDTCVYRPEDTTLQHNGLEEAVIVPSRLALIGMMRRAGFQTVLELPAPQWAPELYTSGKRVLLLCFKSGGPGLEMEPF
ncbi:MAG: class I SAM-dependent methyltransferase [Phycisphaerales bacterium]|jgi:SAM-dependent methyltransferase|nr:class I SAM-dependent methyltransferase [Phycisphaerales bacterium]